jgi:hypothetical protein
MQDVHWWRSGYDEQVHAFGVEQAGERFAEALCEHSVPTEKLTLSDEGRRCMACLLIYGDQLADHHEAQNIDVAWGA